MKVILAQPRGFCAGVVRAIEIVERALQKYGPPVYVRHEIVHNKHVVESLKAKGARVRRGPFRSAAECRHDVQRPRRRQERGGGGGDARAAGAQCDLPAGHQGAQPGQALCRRRAAQLILIGHAGHPEVEGTMGQISEPVTLVQTEKEVDELDIPPTRRSPM